MLGKGLESLIPSGGYKPQGSGAQLPQNNGLAQSSSEQPYYAAPAAAPLYEAVPSQGYQVPVSGAAPSTFVAQQQAEPPATAPQSAPPSQAYYDFTRPIMTPQPVPEPVYPQYDRPAPIPSQQPERAEVAATYPPTAPSYVPPVSISPVAPQQVERSYQPVLIPQEVVHPAVPSYAGFASTEREREIAISDEEGHHLAPMTLPEDYSKNGGTVYQIDVTKIFPNPHQPRRYFDDAALSDLANSIREFGIIQPLVVTRIDGPAGDTYQLIAGERRLMAAKRVGLSTVPAVIKSVAMDRERLELAIIENIQRENLNPLEAARSYSRLQDEFNLTQREIASRMGKSRETIANTLRLLNLPTEVQQALEEGRINESHARLLLQVDDIAKQKEMFSTILRFKPSVRELKAQLKRNVQAPSGRAAYSNPELLSLKVRLEETLGTKVQINDEGDKGKITINYYSADELSDLISKLSRPWGY